MMTDAIRTAVLSGAQVINISVSGGCSVWDWICSLPPDNIYATFERAALFAASSGVIVLAAAGNDGINLMTMMRFHARHRR